jgi:hypothetical protein
MFVFYSASILGQSADIGFDKGIYLQNKSILIPWKMSISNPINIGYPTLISTNEKSIDLEWKDVTIFNGLKVRSLICNVFDPEKKPRLCIISILPDSTYSVEELKQHLDKLTGDSGKKFKTGPIGKRKQSTDYRYHWHYLGCRIDLSSEKTIWLMKTYLF